MGRTMAAACSGGTNSDISGSAMTPRPRKPPLEMPSRQTPMTATAMKAGSASNSTGTRRWEKNGGRCSALWRPLAKAAGALTIAAMDAKTSRYAEVYARWQRDPHGFWGEAANAIDWIEKPKTVFDPNAGVYGRWFPDGVCNTCWNAVDRHVEAGRGTQPAIIYDSPVANSKQTITYAALQTKTETLAGILEKDFGVKKGDRVILYMPMVPEAVVAMLACARIGAIHYVVFGGFAPKELATRINDCTPKVIISASCGIEGARVIPYKPVP